MFLLEDKVGVAGEWADKVQVKTRQEGEASSDRLSDDGPLSKQTARPLKQRQQQGAADRDGAMVEGGVRGRVREAENGGKGQGLSERLLM